MNIPIPRKFRILVSIITVLGLLVPIFAQAAVQTGIVKSGDTAIAQAKITLYQAAIGNTSRARILGRATADDSGFFQITFTPPSTDNAVLYLIADAPRIQGDKGKGSSQRNAVRFATILGTAPFPPEVVINDLTTVASAYSLAQFFPARP